MGDAPDYIWATVNGMSTHLPSNERYFIGGWSQIPNSPRAVRYVHADCIAELKAENERLKSTLAIRDHEAVCDVLDERRRQIEAEGWTPEHDDKEHDTGDLAAAAAAYALRSADMLNPYSQGDGRDIIPDFWPFSKKWWKPSDPRRDLVKAGALILAEIERLDRAAGGKP